MIDHLKFWFVLAGVYLGFLLGLTIDPAWIRSVRRALWKFIHIKGCPLPLETLRKERLKDYRFFSEQFGCDFHVESFDVRGRCPDCGRVHRVAMKIYSPIKPLL